MYMHGFVPNVLKLDASGTNVLGINKDFNYS